MVIAKEKLFFEDEGLEVRLEAQANWKILLDRVILESSTVPIYSTNTHKDTIVRKITNLT